MNRFSFTQRRLDSLPTPAAGRVTYHDAKIPELCIRVSSTGHKAAYLSKSVAGRHVKLKLGTWGTDIRTVQALRAAAQKALPQLDVLPARRREARTAATLGDLWLRWEAYIESHKRPKSVKEDRRQWEAYLKGWARRRLADIGRKDVATLHARLGRDHGRYQANRVLALLSGMFAEGERQGLCQANPCRGIRRFKEEKRDRYLDGDELARFFEALETEPQRDFFLLLLLTGCRRGSLLAMRWQEIDWERGLWRIPDAKGGQVVVVPLVAPAVAILEARRREANGHGWVFPGRYGRGHLVDPMPAWRRICQRAGLENARIHDLRRTLGSWMAKDGAPILTIAKALGHADLSSTEVYARLSVDPVREAVDKATEAMLGAAEKKNRYTDF